MEKRILETLTEIEARHTIKILFACETGSRAWGFASPDSDYDVRFIYKHTEDWYLSLREKADTLEHMSADGELDITGWDIKKCLQLMWKSNGALLERVQSPIVYTMVADVQPILKMYSELYFSPVATLHHYMGMAKTAFAEVEGKTTSKLKRLFYALRATLACKWILEKGSVPPIVFASMLNELSFDVSLKARIQELTILKADKPESYLHPNEESLCAFITKELQKASRGASVLSGHGKRADELDVLFYRFVKTY